MNNIAISELPDCLQFVASLSTHPIVIDEDGTYRFKENKVVGWLHSQGILELNKIWTAFHNDAFPIEDLMRFYRELGYSLCGFEEIFGSHLDELEAKAFTEGDS